MKLTAIKDKKPVFIKRVNMTTAEAFKFFKHAFKRFGITDIRIRQN